MGAQSIATSKKYDLNYVNATTSKSMGIDPGWGSSASAVVVTQFSWVVYTRLDDRNLCNTVSE